MYKNICTLFLLCSVLQCIAAQELIDLEKNLQDFVLETKQIIIPEFPGAFNASIVRWQDSLLMCFRVRDNNSISTFEFGFVWLDDDFNPISTSKILQIYGDPSSYRQNQDARLIVVKNKLYILYNNFIKIAEDNVSRRMFIAELHCDKEKFFIENPTCLQPINKMSKRWEKNWVPFNYNNNLLLAYSLAPHNILNPSLDTGKCETESSTHSFVNWKWGELRGGTPALLDGDQYIAFFHSSTYLATEQSGGKKMQHYFMGAYTFLPKSPFEIAHISPKPIIGKNFYSGPTYNTRKPLRVVFPMGCIANEDYIWITYGRQDNEMWVAKLDKKKLYESLIPVT
ncbi:hypothetical protein M1446_02675 [Candidatus Dependentiae bacterium]|nr:hypothetical protein [Candidatus Dependentiae bacterium]